MLQSVRRKLDGTKILAADTSVLTRAIAAANQRAVGLARQRLTECFPSVAISQLGGHFANAGFYAAEQGVSSSLHWSIDRLLQHLCSRVHSVALGKKAERLQIGLIGTSLAPDVFDIGDLIEPHSDLYALEPASLRAAADSNASIEIRLFDRQLPEWAATADDFVAVSGADVFMKLFIAGGEASVNGWHRDSSDVFATVLDGRKRFQVGTTTCSEDAPVCDVDSVLTPGSALLVPRSRLHNVTPVYGASALLSVGLMRRGDWSYRGETPTHLGLTDLSSAQLYRLALRSHSPMASSLPQAGHTWRSKTPGGIGIVVELGETVTFVAGGRLWMAPLDLVNALVRIHGAVRTTSSELAADVGRSEEWCIQAGTALIDFGLIQPA
jgi:hypothetical protein